MHCPVAILWSLMCTFLVYVAIPWSMLQSPGLCCNPLVYVAIPGLCCNPLVYVAIPWFHCDDLVPVAIPWAMLF